MSYYQDDRRISRSEFVHILKEDANAEILWKKSNVYGAISYGFAMVELGFMIWYVNETVDSVNTNSGDFSNRSVPLIGMIGATVGSVIFAVARADAQRDAILTHNRGFDLGRIQPMLGIDKVGIVVNF